MLPGSSFLGFQEGANEEAADWAAANGKPAKVNAWQKLFGAKDEDAQNIFYTKQQEALKGKYGSELAQVGLMVDWKDTEQDIQRKLAKRKENRAIGQRNRTESIEAKRSTDEREGAKEIKQMDITANAESDRRRIAADNNRFAFTTKIEGMRQDHQAEQADLNRALERQLSNNSNDLQMQMSFMNADLEEKRMAYKEETRRMDRRDRMIANLMSGIGQLGAGFAG